MDNFEENRSIAEIMAILRRRLQEKENQILEDKWQSLQKKVGETIKNWNSYKGLRKRRQEADAAHRNAKEVLALNVQKTSHFLKTQPMSNAINMMELHVERSELEERVECAWIKKHQVDLEMTKLIGPLMGSDNEMELYDALLWDGAKKAENELLEAMDRLKPPDSILGIK